MFMGERSAVRPKSGQSVCESDPGLRRPTPPVTAGRKPAARPPHTQQNPVEETAREAGLAQPKIRRGAGQSPAVSTQREALCNSDDPLECRTNDATAFDDSQIASLIDFFSTLDRWDREAHGQPTM